ncbi:MAG: hypothetical protein ACPGXL_05140 [Chitinophagales bacterium]
MSLQTLLNYGLSFYCLLSICMTTNIQAQEIQVSFTEDISYLDVSTAEQLGLFAEIENLIDARLFLQPDSSHILEISYLENGKKQIERQALTPDEVASLRKNVQEKATQLPTAGKSSATVFAPDALQQNGRFRLLTNTTLLSVALYGGTAPLLLNEENINNNPGSTLLGSYAVAGLLGFGLPYLATQDKDISVGVANLTSGGMANGFVHGFALGGLILDNEFQRLNNNRNRRIFFGSAIGLSVVEGLAGYHYAKKTDLAAGSANLISSLGSWGTLWGIGTVIATNQQDIRPAAGMLLGGAAIGTATGIFLRNDNLYTEGDVNVLSNMMTTGMMTPMVAVALFNGSDERVYAAGAILGSVVALKWGLGQMHSHDFNFRQGNIMALGQMIGAGTGLLLTGFSTQWNPSGSQLIKGIGIGSMASFAALYALLEKDARILPRKNKSKRSGNTKRDVSWDFDLHPDGLLSLTGNGTSIGTSSNTYYGSATNITTGYQPTLVSLRLGF